MSQENSSGYSWSVKELIPFIVALITALGGVASIYATFSSRISMLEVELSSLKKEQNSTSEKIDRIVQSNNDLAISVRSLVQWGEPTYAKKR